MGQIYLENIRTYSHHGCMKEETVIGSEYLVDLWVDADLTFASSSDDLNSHHPHPHPHPHPYPHPHPHQ